MADITNPIRRDTDTVVSQWPTHGGMATTTTTNEGGVVQNSDSVNNINIGPANSILGILLLGGAVLLITMNN